MSSFNNFEEGVAEYKNNPDYRYMMVPNIRGGVWVTFYKIVFPRSANGLIGFNYKKRVHTDMEITDIVNLLGVRVSPSQAHRQRQVSVMDQIGWLPMFQSQVSEEGFEEFSNICK